MDPEIVNGSEIISNLAVSGGGIYSVLLSNPFIQNSTVCGNAPDQIFDTYIDGGGNTIGNSCSEANADVNDDGEVDGSDVMMVFEFWGTEHPHVDLDKNGVVDVPDVMIVVSELRNSKKQPKKENKKGKSPLKGR